MCGIVGIAAQSSVHQLLYDALIVLQHRGQDAAGIVTEQDGYLFQRKASGLVKDVFHQHHMQQLHGTRGIGHVRYPTAGSTAATLAQPLYVNSPYGISLAHNGNLTNAHTLSHALFQTDLRHLNTDSDSEVLLNIFAHELQAIGTLVPSPAAIFQAVRGVHRRCRGAYAAIALIAKHGIVGIRDPHGIRPLVLGQRDTPKGPEHMLASESVALDTLGFSLVRDVAPGEAIYLDNTGTVHSQICTDNPVSSPCIFEYVYFARPDSMIDGIAVYKARMRQGEYLAAKIKRLRPHHAIDVVIPIPESSRIAGQLLAYNLGVKFREGLIKNRYIGRTFIMPGQQLRKQSVRQKLNAIALEFAGKNVMLVDDSIVRGTTCQQIVQMARDAGAAKVYLASASPPIRYPNVYGIDMPAASELIAHNRDEQAIAEYIGVDWLIYQDLNDVIASVQAGNPAIRQFDCSIFTGHYITNDIDVHYLQALEAKRKDRSLGVHSTTM